MQNFTEISENTNLRASLPQILNNDQTALTNSSGSAWPTAPVPTDGRSCYRTDQKKLYMWANGGWKLIMDFAKTPIFRQDADGLYAPKGHNHDSVYARKGIDETFTKSLTVNANLTVKGIIYNTSDAGMKKDILRIKDGLEKVGKLKGYTYALKETGAPSAGVMAHEVREACPELIAQVDEGAAVNYNGVTALLIEAVNELAQKVEILEKRII